MFTDDHGHLNAPCQSSLRRTRSSGVNCRDTVATSASEFAFIIQGSQEFNTDQEVSVPGTTEEKKQDAPRHLSSGVGASGAPSYFDNDNFLITFGNRRREVAFLETPLCWHKGSHNFKIFELEIKPPGKLFMVSPSEAYRRWHPSRICSETLRTLLVLYHLALQHPLSRSKEVKKREREREGVNSSFCVVSKIIVHREC